MNRIEKVREIRVGLVVGVVWGSVVVAKRDLDQLITASAALRISFLIYGTMSPKNDIGTGMRGTEGRGA